MSHKRVDARLRRAMAKCGCPGFRWRSSGLRRWILRFRAGMTGRFNPPGPRGSFAPPHAVVGVFIVNNSPETMAGRFYNQRFASRSSHDGCAGGLAAAAICVRAAKSPAGCPVRAAGVASVNTLLWKILVTRVKRVVRGFVSCACCGAPKA